MYSEDDDSASAAPSKKLAFLFEKGTNVSGNSSLMYKAPKQPRSLRNSSPSHSSQTQPKETLNLVLLKLVQCYKFENDNYNSQGKLGAAILGSISSHQYQLLLYREKTSHITQSQITPQFWFAVQPKNYATFKDKNNVLWSLLFENSSSLVKFSTEIALARWGCTERHDCIISQDLSVNESNNIKKIEEGSQVEISYTAHLLSPANKLDKEIEVKENISLIVLPDQGWKSTLIGAILGSQKLVILPPNQLGHWKTLVPEDYSLVVEINILSASTTSSSITLPCEVSSSPEKNVKARGASINEALTNSPPTSRASLISRISRMGQATLPLKGARVPDVSDSDETEEDVSSSAFSSDNTKIRESSKEQKPVPITRQSVSIPQSTPATVFTPASHQLMMNQAAVFEGIGTTISTAAMSPADSQLPIYFSELRTNNSELRMGLNRVTDKVDKVLDKMDTSSLDRVLQQLQTMEKNMLSQFNVIQQQNVELGNVLKQEDRRSVVNLPQQDPVERLEKEKAELISALSQSATRTKELHEKLEELNTLKVDLHQQLKLEKESRESIDKENSAIISQLQIQLQEQEKNVKFWEAALEKISCRVPELERRIEDRQKNQFKENKDAVRKLMMTVYKNLHARFPQDSTVYKTSEIHAVLGEIIKATTLEYLKPQAPKKANEKTETVDNISPQLAKDNCMDESQISDNPTQKDFDVRMTPELKKIEQSLSLPDSEIKSDERLSGEENRSNVQDESCRLQRKPEGNSSFLADENVASHSKIDCLGGIKLKEDEETTKNDHMKSFQQSGSSENSSEDTKKASIQETESKQSLSFDGPPQSSLEPSTIASSDEVWSSQQPPPLLFEDDEDDRENDDDWLK